VPTILGVTESIPVVPADRIPAEWQQLVVDAHPLGLHGIASLGVAATVTALQRGSENASSAYGVPLFTDGGEGYDVVHPVVAEAVSQLKKDEADLADAGIAALSTLRGIQAVHRRRQSGRSGLHAADEQNITALGLQLDLHSNLLKVTDILGVTEGAFVESFRMRWQQKASIDTPANVLEVAANMYANGYFNNYAVSFSTMPYSGSTLAFCVLEGRSGLLSPVNGELPPHFLRLGQAMMVGAACE
jgi:hypothetical protein